MTKHFLLLPLLRQLLAPPKVEKNSSNNIFYEKDNKNIDELIKLKKKIAEKNRIAAENKKKLFDSTYTLDILENKKKL